MFRIVGHPVPYIIVLLLIGRPFYLLELGYFIEKIMKTNILCIISRLGLAKDKAISGPNAALLLGSEICG